MPDGAPQQHPDHHRQQQPRRPFAAPDHTPPQNGAYSFLFRAFERALLSVRRACMPTRPVLHPHPPELSVSPSLADRVDDDARSESSCEDRAASALTSTPELCSNKFSPSLASPKSNLSPAPSGSPEYYTPPSSLRKARLKSIIESAEECSVESHLHGDAKSLLKFDDEQFTEPAIEPQAESEANQTTESDVRKDECVVVPSGDEKAPVPDVAAQLAELATARAELRAELAAGVRAHAQACAEAERAARALTVRALELDNRALELDAREARVALREQSHTSRATLVQRERRAAACAAELDARRTALNEAAAAQQVRLTAEREHFWALQRSVSSVVAKEIEQLQNEQQLLRDELSKRRQDAEDSIALMHDAAKQAAAAIVQAGEPVPKQLKEAAKRVLGIEALSPVAPGSLGPRAGKLVNPNGCGGAGSSAGHALAKGTAQQLGRDDVRVAAERAERSADVRAWTDETKRKPK